MGDNLHIVLEGLLSAALGGLGWFLAKLAKKLELIDRHETKIQVHEEKFVAFDGRVTHLESDVHDLVRQGFLKATP